MFDCWSELDKLYNEGVKEQIRQIKSANMSKEEIKAEIKKIDDEIALSHKEQWELVKKQPRFTNFWIRGGSRSQCKRIDALKFCLEHMK